MDLGGGGPAAAAPAAAAPLADLLGGGLDQLIGGGGGLAADPVSGNVLNAKHTYCHVMVVCCVNIQQEPTLLLFLLFSIYLLDNYILFFVKAEAIRPTVFSVTSSAWEDQPTQVHARAHNTTLISHTQSHLFEN